VLSKQQQFPNSWKTETSKTYYFKSPWVVVFWEDSKLWVGQLI